MLCVYIYRIALSANCYTEDGKRHTRGFGYVEDGNARFEIVFASFRIICIQGELLFLGGFEFVNVSVIRTIFFSNYFIECSKIRFLSYEASLFSNGIYLTPRVCQSDEYVTFINIYLIKCGAASLNAIGYSNFQALYAYLAANKN